jgi:hypothetical protein
MTHLKSLMPRLLATAIAMAATSPIVAQPADREPPATPPRTVDVPGHGNVIVQPVPTDNPRAVPRLVTVPGVGEVYVLPIGPKDARTSRQRCIDDETERRGGSLSPLEQSIVDLNCSQR